MFTGMSIFVYNNAMNELLKDCDCAIVTSPASLYYLSGIDQSDAVILLAREESLYLTNPLYEVAVKPILKNGFSLKILSRSETTAFLRQKVADATVIGIEYDDLTLSRFYSLMGETSKRTVDLSPVLGAMRMRKRKEEITLIRRAESIVDRAFSEIRPLLKKGVTEKEIKDELVYRLLKNGAQGEAFDTIVAFGENAAKPHAVPSDRALKAGDAILMDFGAKLGGYCSDFTRTLYFGEPTKEFRKAYDLVLRAQKAAITYLEEGGRSASEADRIAREIIDESPFRGAFNHTLGHGVGLQIHEAPYLSAQSKDLLGDDMIFTIEPGVYVEGEFGIRIESLVSIENGKLTVIDRSDKENYTI